MGLYSLSDLEYMFWAAIRNGSVGTIGAKGDPGGLVKGPDLTTQNLNDIKTPGIYFQPATSKGTVLNYPNNTRTAGTLTVNGWYRDGIDVIQTFVAAQVIGVAGYDVPATTWQRTLYNSVWTTWRAQTTQRIDQTAGRAMYIFDEVNNREQIVYGDTGWRKVVNEGEVATQPNLSVYARREGRTVTMSTIEHTAGGSTTAATLLYNIPAGFKPNSGQTNPAMIFSGTILDEGALPIANTSLYSITAGADTLMLKPASGKRHYGVISYPTNDAWPTVLPGTAVGIIPNL